MTNWYNYSDTNTGKFIAPYFAKANIKLEDFINSKKLPIVAIRYLFLMLSHDYLNNKITLRQMLDIVTDIYWNTEVWNLSDYDNLDREFSRIISLVADQGNYLDRKGKIEQFNKEIKPKIEEYYKKYKYLVEKYIN